MIRIMDTIKSIPAGDLEVTALTYTHIAQDATGQDGDGRDYTEVETEVINPELDARATFGQFAGRCACCGSTRLIYACRVVHKPTLAGYYIGRDCAAKLIGMADGAYARMSVALVEKAESRRRRNGWLAKNPQHREIVEWAEGSTHHIASDIVRKLRRYGSISGPQLDLLHRIKTQITEVDNEPQPTGPAPEGRIEVAVTVLGTKQVENRFSYHETTVRKALVRLDGYNTKAWITAAGLERGDKAILRATFTRSDRDPHFAFGSRPTIVRHL